MKTNLGMLAMVCTVVLFLIGNAFATEIKHEIVKGDTLIEIAKKYHGKKMGYKFKEIAKQNHIKNPNMIIAGKFLTISVVNGNATAKSVKVQQKKNVSLPESSVVTIASPSAFEDEAKIIIVQLLEKESALEKKIAMLEGQAALVSDKKTDSAESSPVEKLQVAEIKSVVQEIEQPIEPIEIIYAPKKEPEKKVDKIATISPPPEIADDRFLNLATYTIKKTQRGLFMTTESMEKKEDDSAVEVDGELGYFWGCLNLPGKCQWLGADIDIYGNINGTNKLGLNLGADLVFANMQDSDSNLRRSMYSVFAGVAYKYEGEKSTFVIKNGVAYQETEDDISGVGSEIANTFTNAFTGMGIDPTSLGVDLSSLNVNFKRNQAGLLAYNNTDYLIKFENWKAHFGTELRIPLKMRFSTNLPSNSAGSSKMDQTLAIVSFGVQRKINTRTYLGIEAFPVFYSGETKMSGAKTALALDYRNLAIEGGVLMYPYGLSKEALASGGSFEKMLNAFLAFKVKF